MKKHVKIWYYSANSKSIQQLSETFTNKNGIEYVKIIQVRNGSVRCFAVAETSAMTFFMAYNRIANATQITKAIKSVNDLLDGDSSQFKSLWED